MSQDLSNALTMMGIALPTMFAVIIGFILATTGLRKLFPYDPEKDSDD